MYGHDRKGKISRISCQHLDAYIQSSWQAYYDPLHWVIVGFTLGHSRLVPIAAYN